MHIGYYSLANNTSTSNFGLMEKISDKNNYSFQPRVSARYLLSEDWSVKASYAKMQQNIHLLSNSSVGFPSDIWVPAIDSVPSQTSEQWAANITTQLYNGTFELSLEGYYKTMRDLIAYKAGYSNLESSEFVNSKTFVNSALPKEAEIQIKKIKLKNLRIKNL